MRTESQIAADTISMSAEEFRRLMRAHRVTIRELAARMNVPMRAVRAARNDGLRGFGVFDFEQGVTGEFSPRRRAQLAAIRRGFAESRGVFE